MEFDEQLKTVIRTALQDLFQLPEPEVNLQPTNSEFSGSHTLMCFGFTKKSRLSPEATGKMIGDYLLAHAPLVAHYQVVKGFLNLTLHDWVWTTTLQQALQMPNYGRKSPNGREMLVEYSSPNTNKPLHLGHLRNNFLGAAVANLLEAQGYATRRVQIINDRGIHIAKSMTAWEKYGNGETPTSSGIKGDHLVGKYYVQFDKKFKEEVRQLVNTGVPPDEAEKKAPIMQSAVDMLRRWEAKDPAVMALWETMNGWVYEGFEATYRRMGVCFDKLYYESSTYLLGKEEAMKGLAQGVFYQKEDGSVWVDLTADGLDHKILLRSDGTSVYMTQDIGTAILRFLDFPHIDGQIYTVGNEQDYHFKVLFLILKKLGYAWAEKCYHLSYGMVDLPSGKMKSREGTVVDADELMEEVCAAAEEQTRLLGKVEDMSEAEVKALAENVGMGALKFFLLKVDPKKRMLFEPAESIRLQGHTGPFIQYTHARIQALLRKAREQGIVWSVAPSTPLQDIERKVIITLYRFPDMLEEAAAQYSPALSANYIFELAKSYNQLYQSVGILNEENVDKRALRLALSDCVGRTIRQSLSLLGINSPDKM